MGRLYEFAHSRYQGCTIHTVETFIPCVYRSHKGFSSLEVVVQIWYEGCTQFYWGCTKVARGITCNVTSGFSKVAWGCTEFCDVAGRLHILWTRVAQCTHFLRFSTTFHLAFSTKKLALLSGPLRIPRVNAIKTTVMRNHKYFDNVTSNRSSFSISESFNKD